MEWNMKVGATFVNYYILEINSGGMCSGASHGASKVRPPPTTASFRYAGHMLGFNCRVRPFLVG